MNLFSSCQDFCLLHRKFFLDGRKKFSTHKMWQKINFSWNLDFNYIILIVQFIISSKCKLNRYGTVIILFSVSFVKILPHEQDVSHGCVRGPHYTLTVASSRVVSSHFHNVKIKKIFFLIANFRLPFNATLCKKCLFLQKLNQI